MTNEEGRKADAEKTQLGLLSSKWVYGVGQVLTFGARKYEAHNWRKGIKRSRLLDAALRHLFSYLGGEDYDVESGLLHLYHASCCLMFASELHYSRPDLDDRYGVNQSGAPKSENIEKSEEPLPTPTRRIYLICFRCQPQNTIAVNTVLARCEHGNLRAATPGENAELMP